MGLRTVTGINITDVVDAKDFVNLYNGCVDDGISNHIVDLAFDGGYIKTFTEEDRQRYRFNPKLLSYDLYGTPDLGLLILKINGMMHPGEFDLAELKAKVFSDNDILSLTQMFKALHTTTGDAG